MYCKLANQLIHSTARCLLVESLAIGNPNIGAINGRQQNVPVLGTIFVAVNVHEQVDNNRAVWKPRLLFALIPNNIFMTCLQINPVTLFLFYLVVRERCTE